MDFQVEICTKKKKYIFFFYKSETVKNFHFFFETKKLSLFFWNRHEIYWPVLWKKGGFRRNHLYFLFLFWISFTWNFMKLAVLVSDFFGIKKETGWWFHYFKGHKIMKPPEISRETKWNWRHAASGKKWNWRHAAAPRPSVSFFTRRRGRQFHFVPDWLWRFHNFSPLK